jgi:hypothetical protein
MSNEGKVKIYFDILTWNKRYREGKACVGSTERFEPTDIVEWVPKFLIEAITNGGTLAHISASNLIHITKYRGPLAKGQVWVKGRNQRVIYDFDDQEMAYQTKKNIREGLITSVPRSVFRRWLYSGEGASLKTGE